MVFVPALLPTPPPDSSTEYWPASIFGGSNISLPLFPTFGHFTTPIFFQNNTPKMLVLFPVIFVHQKPCTTLNKPIGKSLMISIPYDKIPPLESSPNTLPKQMVTIPLTFGNHSITSARAGCLVFIIIPNTSKTRSKNNKTTEIFLISKAESILVSAQPKKKRRRSG